MFSSRTTRALHSRKTVSRWPTVTWRRAISESEGQTYTCNFVVIVWPVTSATLHPNPQCAKPLADRPWSKIPLQAGRRGLSLSWMTRSHCDISPVAQDQTHRRERQLQDLCDSDAMIRVPPLHEWVSGMRSGVEMQGLCVSSLGLG